MTSTSENIHEHLSTRDEFHCNQENTTPWLELSCNKYSLQDLLRGDTGESFAILASEIPLNNEGTILERQITTKIAEAEDGNPKL